jgi:predicted nucleic acid-binding Zn ribbon protein
MTPARRAAIIAEWRGLPQPIPARDRCKMTAELISVLMQKLGLKERLRETEVIAAWHSIVGDFLAGHSAPATLRDGVLYVRVLQPALHYELERIAKPKILARLKRRFGAKTVCDVRFRLG